MEIYSSQSDCLKRQRSWDLGANADTLVLTMVIFQELRNHFASDQRTFSGLYESASLLICFILGTEWTMDLSHGKVSKGFIIIKAGWKQNFCWRWFHRYDLSLPKFPSVQLWCGTGYHGWVLPPSCHQKCHIKRFQHDMINWLAFTSNTIQFYSRYILYICFSVNGFKIWNLYLNLFQQSVLFSTDKNNELLLHETKAQYTFPVCSLKFLSRKKSGHVLSIEPMCIPTSLRLYCSYKFHQIMPWNLCWPLNCESETSKTDKMVE